MAIRYDVDEFRMPNRSEIQTAPATNSKLSQSQTMHARGISLKEISERLWGCKTDEQITLTRVQEHANNDDRAYSQADNDQHKKDKIIEYLMSKLEVNQIG